MTYGAIALAIADRSLLGWLEDESIQDLEFTLSEEFLDRTDGGF